MARCPGGFCICHAGPGQRAYLARRLAALSRATCRAWPQAQQSRRLRCPSRRPARTSPRWSVALDPPARITQLDGCKTWISNGGIADFYCVFARTAPAELRNDGSTLAQGISAFVVDADAPGLHIEERIDSMAPHPLAILRFAGCRVPVEQRLGPEGGGFKLALRTLDIFRTSVAAAALGFARRALDEALRHARTRRMFGQTLGDFQLTQGALADMATDLQAATLLTYHAAWRRDQGHNVTLEAAMAKMSGDRSRAACD